jgi:hypothetical protein
MRDLQRRVSDEELGGLTDFVYDYMFFGDAPHKFWATVNAIDTVLLERYPSWMDEFYQGAMIGLMLQDAIFWPLYDTVSDEVNERDRGDCDAFVLGIENEFIHMIFEFRCAENAEDDCPICMVHPRAPVRTRCNHIFCFECIAEWARTNPTCPLCRVRLCRVRL